MFDLLFEPKQEVLRKIHLIDGEPEMSDFESAFICGLIKKYEPRRILEIGVAAGGTTSIILQCICQLGLYDKCEIYSLDLNKKFYRDRTKETGFLARELIEKLEHPINHTFLLGKVLAEQMENIGNNFDLVVLDTVHSLPGEVLDMPLILKLLSPQGHVVLHDIAYHYYYNRNAISNQVLFDVMLGDRIIPFGCDKEKSTEMPNIGVIGINEDSYKCVESIFYALTLPWAYIPDGNELDAYMNAYSKYYPENIVNIFKVAIQLNAYEKESMPLKERIWRCGVLMLKGKTY